MYEYENEYELEMKNLREEDPILSNKIDEEQFLKEKQKALNNAIQTHLDEKAQEFRYDNMISARSYAGFVNPYKAEAQKLAVWASNCWFKFGEINNDVQSGKREIPTVDVFLSELPLFK